MSDCISSAFEGRLNVGSEEEKVKRIQWGFPDLSASVPKVFGL